MGKRSFLKRSKPSDEMQLQITSMADVFVVVLVFLLKSYAVSAVDVMPSPGVKLPNGRGTFGGDKALKLELSDSAVKLEGQVISPMNHFVFPNGDVDGEGLSRALSQALARAKPAALAKAAPRAGEAKAEGEPTLRVLVIADHHAPYSTIKTVLASSAAQGYSDIQLAVARDE